MSGYSKEDFLKIAQNKPEDTKKVLKEHFEFTVEGIKKYCKKDLVACNTFFSNLIGKPFDSANEGHSIFVLEAGISSAENMASVMWFIFENFMGEEKEKKMSDEEAKKDMENQNKSIEENAIGLDHAMILKDIAKKKKQRKATNWVAMDIPFKEGSNGYHVFGVILNFDGTRQELLIEIKKMFVEKNLVIKSSAAALLNWTLMYAAKRGWTVEKSKDRILVKKQNS